LPLFGLDNSSLPHFETRRRKSSREIAHLTKPSRLGTSLALKLVVEAFMKSQKVLVIAVLGAFMAVGCSKKSSSSNSDTTVAVVPPPTTVTPVPIPTGTSGSPTPIGGNTVAFQPVSQMMMEAYTGAGPNQHPLNNPSNYRLTVALHNVGEYHYAGEIRISYTDNGQTYTGIFTAPDGKNEAFPSNGYNRDVGLYKAQYNYWFNYQNQTVFSGFFQDPYGAIVLVLDNSNNLGDGQGATTISGSVWFRNFATTYAQQSDLRNCWFIYMGPYDCRNDIVATKSGLYPASQSNTDTTNYRLLGTFSGLSIKDAFAN
jgi:hypothetical protein